MYQIDKFDHLTASDSLFTAYNNCINLIKAEKLPDDPPVSLEETIQGTQNIPAFITVFTWIVWNKDHSQVIAYADLALSKQDNLHLAQFIINVLPQYRQQGIAKAILSKMMKIAKQENRSSLITATTEKVPAGEAFLNRLGGTQGLKSVTSQLTITELDPKLIDQWIKQAEEKATAFETGLWDGEYPEHQLADIVELYTLVNQQPLDDLEVEEIILSGENLRQIEKSIFAKGNKRWTIYAKRKADEGFAGYTEIIWQPSSPQIINQGFTCVFPKFRGSRLGLLMKAKMLKKIIEDIPEARFIRTGNAFSNVPMLKINVDLGFKPYKSECVWQISAEQVESYLLS